MPRRAINVKITGESHSGWRLFCDTHDVSLAAVLEVVGRRMFDGRMRLNDQVQEIVTEARAVDQERAKRPGPRRRQSR